MSGGDCIIGFETTAIHGQSLYIVRNDRAGDIWEVEQRGRVGYNPTRPKPSPILELVQSA